MRSPRCSLLRFEIGLGQVIYHKALLRKPGYQVDRGGQLSGINQNVVGKAELPQLRNTAKEIVPNKEAVVELVLRNVAKSAKLFELRKVFEPITERW